MPKPLDAFAARREVERLQEVIARALWELDGPRPKRAEDILRHPTHYKVCPDCDATVHMDEKRCGVCGKTMPWDKE